MNVNSLVTMSRPLGEPEIHFIRSKGCVYYPIPDKIYVITSIKEDRGMDGKIGKFVALDLFPEISALGLLFHESFFEEVLSSDEVDVGKLMKDIDTGFKSSIYN